MDRLFDIALGLAFLGGILGVVVMIARHAGKPQAVRSKAVEPVEKCEPPV